MPVCLKCRLAVRPRCLLDVRDFGLVHHPIPDTNRFWLSPRVRPCFVFASIRRGSCSSIQGLNEVVALMNSFSFSPSDIAYLRTVLPHCEEAFFVWLGQLDCQNVRLYALEEGSLCFPRVPLIRVEVYTAVVVRWQRDALCCLRLAMRGPSLRRPLSSAAVEAGAPASSLLNSSFVLLGAAWHERVS